MRQSKTGYVIRVNSEIPKHQKVGNNINLTHINFNFQSMMNTNYIIA